MQNHQFNNQKNSQNISNLLFAREFFKILDVNGNGFLQFNEVTVPFISLGFSSDGKFVMQVLKAINPEKFATEKDCLNKQMTLAEFTSIFKRDIVSDLITKRVIREVLQRSDK